MGLNYFITGGCGFIGVNLVHHLLVTGSADQIVLFDNLTVGQRADLATVCNFSEGDATARSKVHLIVGDILDVDALTTASSGAHVFVHLAANTGVGPSVEEPRKDMEMNVIGTFNALTAAHQNGVGRFIFASSGAPVGLVDPPIHEKLAAKPVSPYGASKLAGEGYCSAFYQTFGLETVALRFGNVYGPRSGHKSSVVAKFIRQAMNGERLEVYGDGTQARDFIFTDDLLAAVRAAATIKGIGGEIFQIATNHETTVSEMLALLVAQFEAAGIAKPDVYYGEKRLGDVMRNYSNTSKAKRVLNWQAQMPLDQGLRETLAWFYDG